MHYNADISGGDTASVAALRESSNVLHRIATIPWLQQALAANSQATVNVDEPSMDSGPLEAVEINEMHRAGFEPAASLLANNFRNALGFWVWLKPDKEATQWYLLPNGDAVLMRYLPSEARLPFDAKTNAAINRRKRPYLNSVSVGKGAIITPSGKLMP
jgi:hypothetical protein